MQDKPLFTFAVAGFNQDRFIREAVQSAFAQTYSPLEIILSDDCSRDRTFEIFQEMAAAYKGPHKVVLNRNPSQRCIGGHINRIMEISKGEMVLAAAGDDVSLPERTQVTWEAWESSGRQATSVHSAILQIDEDGNRIEEVFKVDAGTGSEKFVRQHASPAKYLETLEPLIFGCAHAFSRRLFERFGNLPEEVIHEDNAIGLRSILAGQLLFIKQPLVKYRLHGNNIYVRSREQKADMEALRSQEEKVRRSLNAREIMYRGFLLDLDTAKNNGMLAQAVFDELSKIARRSQKRIFLKRQFFEATFFQKCRILASLRRGGMRGAEFNSLAKRLIPLSLLLRFRLARAQTASTLARR